MDQRAKDLGLTAKEWAIIYNTCKKFTNRRDLMEDLIQEVLAALSDALTRFTLTIPTLDETLETPKTYVRNRSAFIKKVAINSLSYYSSKTSDDLLYHNYSEESGNWCRTANQEVSLDDCHETTSHDTFTNTVTNLIDDMSVSDLLKNVPKSSRFILDSILFRGDHQRSVADRLDLHPCTVSLRYHSALEILRHAISSGVGV